MKRITEEKMSNITRAIQKKCHLMNSSDKLREHGDWSPVSSHLIIFMSADIMASLCGVYVRVRLSDFSDETTRPRDMLFF